MKKIEKPIRSEEDLLFFYFRANNFCFSGPASVHLYLFFFYADQTTVTRNFPFRRSTRANKRLFVPTLSRSSFVDTCIRWHAYARERIHICICMQTYERQGYKRSRANDDFSPRGHPKSQCDLAWVPIEYSSFFFFHLFCFVAFDRLIVSSCVDGANGMTDTTFQYIISIAEHCTFTINCYIDFIFPVPIKLKLKTCFKN